MRRLTPILGYPYYKLEPRATWKIPRDVVDIARRRVGGLITFDQVTRRKLIDILANAYLLGLLDAADVSNDEL